MTIRVIVDDRGPAIPPLERQHLFERFYRGSRAGQRESGQGSGLGLSLVAEHVRLHGGKVWSENAPEHGNRFVVELPLEAAPTDEGAATTRRGVDPSAESAP